MKKIMQGMFKSKPVNYSLLPALAAEVTFETVAAIFTGYHLSENL
jgi:hypothetical protein